MIETLAASIILWLLALTVYKVFKKLRRSKPMDEIKLQKIHVMRLGPFSGQSNSFKGKSIIFMMLLSTLSYAEVSITTLDNFRIKDLSEDELTIAKIAEDAVNGTQLGFHIARPHCIPGYPYLLIEAPKEIEEGSTVYAKISVDKNKPIEAELYLEFTFNASDGKNVGWFFLEKFPSFNNASKVVVKFQPATGMKNQTFILDGLKDSTYQAQQICNSDHMLRGSTKQVKI